MGMCSVNMYVCMYVTNFEVTEISSKGRVEVGLLLMGGSLFYIFMPGKTY